MRDITAGAYEWGGSIHAETMLGYQAGEVAEAIARLRVYHPEATEEDVTKIVNAVGWDRLRMLMNEADGPEIKKEGSRTEAPGANPPTMNGLSEKSSDGSPVKTPNELAS